LPIPEMSVSKVSSFNWEKILSKVNSSDVKRSLNLLRGKANEITSNAGKYGKSPAVIDFNSYKNKLKFTSAAVTTLENAYKNRSLPKYTAALPDFEAKKRAEMLTVAKSVVASTKLELQELSNQLDAFETVKITHDTSIGDLRNRFPKLAKEIEEEINTHQWGKDSGV